MKGAIREIINLFRSDHTIGQRMNYLRYLTSPKREALSYAPVTISIVATSRCTLSCDMCPTHSSKVPKEYIHRQTDAPDMAFDMFRDIIDRFSRAVTVHIIGSGEPLLNKDFFRMVDYAANKNMSVKTFSNGTMVDSHIDDILNSKLDGITISLNGHNGAEFKRMTGMDEKIFTQIHEAIERLIDKRSQNRAAIKVKVSFIIDSQNYVYMPDMAKLAIGLGVDHVFFCNFLGAPYNGLRSDERALPLDGPIAERVRGIFEGFSPEIRRRLTPPSLVDSRSAENRCRSHFSQIRFDGSGAASSCSMMLLNMSGQGRYDDEDVWNNTFFKKMRRDFLLSGDEQIPEPCCWCPDNRGARVA